MNLKFSLLIVLLVYVNSIIAQDQSFVTNLPIFYIETEGQSIPDEPKIEALLGIAWNEDGSENTTADSCAHFNGNIRIEIRGSSSQRYPKKAFGFELKDNNGNDMDFPLLGLPEEEDWILYAPYSDKTLIRNVFTYTIAERFFYDYVPRCKFVELFLNGDYQGVYVLMEKIKRDKNRVDIAKLESDDISGKEITGGYIFKIDKPTGGLENGWYSEFANPYGTRTYYQYEYPNSDKIQPEQEEFIKHYFENFENAVFNLEHSKEKGYQNFVDVRSIIDNIIIYELSKNTDGYRSSVFLHKDRNGKLKVGPIWDFNIAFGNAEIYGGRDTNGLFLAEDLKNQIYQIPFWWNKFTEDPWFSDLLKCRWEYLRANELSINQLHEVADSLVNLLGSSVERNFQRWPVLGEKIWPNYYVGETYNSEVEWMKNWIDKRVIELDSIIPGACNILESDLADSYAKDHLFLLIPDKMNNKFLVMIESGAYNRLKFELFNSEGIRVVDERFKDIKNKEYIEINSMDIEEGLYRYRIYHRRDLLQKGEYIHH